MIVKKPDPGRVGLALFKHLKPYSYPAVLMTNAGISIYLSARDFIKATIAASSVAESPRFPSSAMFIFSGTSGAGQHKLLAGGRSPAAISAGVTGGLPDVPHARSSRVL